MDDITPTPFDFMAASNNDMPNEARPETPTAFDTHFGQDGGLNDQTPRLRSTMSTQFTQQVDQRAGDPDPSPAVAPPVSTMQQQWHADFPGFQNVGTGQFNYGDFTSPYLPMPQQEQQQARPQSNVQQQQPAPAPTSPRMRGFYDKCKPPPPECIKHTLMYTKLETRYSTDKNLDINAYIARLNSASSVHNTQQPHAPLPPNVDSQTPRPNHSLQQPYLHPQPSHPLPIGPRSPGPAIDPYMRGLNLNQPYTNQASPYAQTMPDPAPATNPYSYGLNSYTNQTNPYAQTQPDPAPATIHHHQQGTNSPRPTFSLPRLHTTRTKTPVSKASKPTGITKPNPKPKTPGSPARDVAAAKHPTGWINTFMQPEEHHDITQYGRNSLTGGAAASRMAQPWNRPSVARRGNGLGAEIESGQSRSSSSSAGAAEERREVVVGDDGGDGDNGVSAGAGAGAGGVVGGSASTHSTQSHSAMPPEQAAQTMGTQQADGSQPRGEGVVNQEGGSANGPAAETAQEAGEPAMVFDAGQAERDLMDLFLLY